jgi:hypothetical protein
MDEAFAVGSISWVNNKQIQTSYTKGSHQQMSIQLLFWFIFQHQHITQRSP